MRKQRSKSGKKNNNTLQLPSDEEFLAHPVDAFLGGVMAVREVFEPFIRLAIGEKRAQDIDFGLLVLDNTVYRTNRNLNKRTSDIVYRGHFKSTGKPVVIRIIQEFKDILYEGRMDVELQILGYLVLSMQADEKLNIDEVALPICILMFRKSKNWKPGSLLRRFEHAPSWAKSSIPKFKYYVMGIEDLDDSTILKINGLYIKNILLAMKYARNDQKLLENFDKIFIFATRDVHIEISDFVFRSIFKFIASMTSISQDVLEEKLLNLPPEIKNKHKTALEQIIERRAMWKAEGVAKGKAEGELVATTKFVTNLLKNFPEWTDEKIAAIAACTIDLVLEVRAKNAKS